LGFGQAKRGSAQEIAKIAKTQPAQGRSTAGTIQMQPGFNTQIGVPWISARAKRPSAQEIAKIAETRSANSYVFSVDLCGRRATIT
jgi:hypothetical protein